MSFITVLCTNTIWMNIHKMPPIPHTIIQKFVWILVHVEWKLLLYFSMYIQTYILFYTNKREFTDWNGKKYFFFLWLSIYIIYVHRVVTILLLYFFLCFITQKRFLTNLYKNEPIMLKPFMKMEKNKVSYIRSSCSCLGLYVWQEFPAPGLGPNAYIYMPANIWHV